MTDETGTLDTPDAGAAGLTVEQAMERAGVSERTIRRALRPKNGAAAALPSWRVKGPHGREYRIDPLALDQWIGEREALEAQTGAPVTPDSLTDQARQAWPARQADHPVPSVQSLIEEAVHSAVVPLAARIEELARENGTLTERVHALQKTEEERDTLRMRVRALEATAAATAPPDGPTMQESLSGMPGQGSDAGDLWAQLAAKAAAVPDALTQAFEVIEAAQPDDPPRRGLLARLFRRRP